jgi:antitoxin (DNA-binding transcriptional repressor) of toxin-antitoxin stability system
MEVSITQFRREVFDLVNRAMAGSEVWVTHKGRRFRIAPEGQSTSRLSRITPLAVVSAGGLDDAAMKAEMVRGWEKDWERDFGPAADPESERGKTGIEP